MNRMIAIIVAFLLATMTCTTATDAAQLQRANVVRVATDSSPAGVVSDILSRERGTVWITWNVPAADPESQMCCFNSLDEGAKRGWRGGSCNLEGKGLSIFNNDQAGRDTTKTRTTFSIFLEAVDGRVVGLRMFSDDCPVDAENARVHLLPDVDPAKSVEYLLSLVATVAPAGKSSRKGDLREHTISAIAMHRSPNRTEALHGLIQSALPDSTRGHAAFWLGMKGGAAELQFLKSVLDRPSNSEFKDQVLVGIAQSEDPSSVGLLLSLARTHASVGVRKQSIFWLGQKAGGKLAGELADAADDPDEEVREMAVFAISQLAPDESVPRLITLAKTHSSGTVRERAVFWLGQSGDPRALEFIEEVLTR